MNTLLIKKRNNSIEWAKKVLNNKAQYLIVETETTGLKDTDVIIHIAVMDLELNMLMDTFVKPTIKKHMPEKAFSIHKISMDKLKDAPHFKEVLPQFIELAKGKTLISYNAEFHSGMITNTIDIDEIELPEPVEFHFECAQDIHNDFYNEEYLPLPGRKNTGVGDCNATLDLIEELAQYKVVPIVKVKRDTSYDKFVLITTFVAGVVCVILFGKVGILILLFGAIMYISSLQE